VSLALLLALAVGAADPIASRDGAEAMGAAEDALEAAADAVYGMSGYRWHRTADGTSVQFGVPETDDRALRIDCHGGRIEIIGPVNSNAAERTRTSVGFAGGEVRGGTIEMLGDGPNFVASLDPADPVIAAALAQPRLVIVTPDTHLSLPAEGARAVVEPLLADCRAAAAARAEGVR
jgi:hypothetical protein